MLKLDGDDELIYLDSDRELQSECSELLFSDDDYVIDSAGFSYLISEQLTLIRTDRIFVVDELIHLIRANEFKKAELCLTKINFLSVADAIKALL
nr:DUF4144 family protein [Colwellia piezophila]